MSMIRLEVDFNKHGGGFVLLTTEGTRRSLARLSVQLVDDMKMLLYQEDSDAPGLPGMLEAEGFVYREGGRWAARLTSDIRFVPGTGE